MRLFFGQPYFFQSFRSFFIIIQILSPSKTISYETCQILVIKVHTYQKRYQPLLLKKPSFPLKI